ncbi:MAG TPA: YetF domain-containing protein [Proteiniclasticum sp.]|nr:YetF domain-containing protein [Proteiniclasticum sp.]
MKGIFIGSSDYIIRMLLVGVLSYFLLILIIRITGKRTLSKMNAFDLIITVALGSSFATVILDTSIALLEGMAALGLLILLQYVITFTSVRSKAVRKLIKSDPTLLYYHGLFIEKNMKKERISKDEIDQHVRNNGYSSYKDVSAVVLESDGSLSVLGSDGDLLPKQ